jgi:carbon storage regulator
MLVLSRRIGETIVIGDNVEVKVVRLERGRVCLGITAPTTTSVDRQEVREQRRKPGEGPAPPQTAADHA